MTDLAGRPSSSLAGGQAARLKRRHAKSRRLQFYGIAAIAVAVGMLGLLLWTMVSNGYSAFSQTHLTMEVTIPADVDPANVRDVNFREIVKTSWLSSLENVPEEDEEAPNAWYRATMPRAALDEVVGDDGKVYTRAAYQEKVAAESGDTCEDIPF